MTWITYGESKDFFERFGGRPLTDEEVGGLREVDFFETAESLGIKFISMGPNSVENPGYRTYNNAIVTLSREVARVLAADPLIASALWYIGQLDCAWKDIRAFELLLAVRRFGMCRTEEQWEDLANHEHWCRHFGDLRDIVKSNPPAEVS